MRILFLSHYFPPEVNAPANRTLEHCREWVRMGHDVHVVTCIPSHPAGRPFQGYRRRWRQLEVIEGIQVHRVWTYLAPNRGRFRRSLNYLSYVPTAVWRSLRLGRFDIIVATSPQFFCAFAGWWSHLFKRTPWIFELRDLWPDSIAAVGAVKTSWLITALEKLELHLYRSAAGVACVTRAFIKNLESRGIPPEKCAFIPNGIVPEDWAGLDGKSAREKYGVTDAQVMISYVGTVGMAHQVGVLVEAAERARSGNEDFRFFVVGDGAELETLKRWAREKGLENIQFTGLVSREAAKAFVSASDLIVVHLKESPLFKTVLPSKMFEAMAAAKPVILGVGGEARATLEQAEAGVCIPPGDADALLKAAGELARNRKKTTVMGQNGRAYVNENFSRRAWAERYLSWIGSLLHGAAGSITEHRPGNDIA